MYTVAFALFVIGCSIVFFKRQKNGKKVLDEELLKARILAFKPESIIDYSSISSNDSNIEIPAPDESIPGCLNLVKVNYYNFLNSEHIKNEAEACIRTYGVGSCGPRGFYGTIDVHLTLESNIAKFMDMEETVLYSYGFTTVSSAIGAYCKKTGHYFL